MANHRTSAKQLQHKLHKQPNKIIKKTGKVCSVWRNIEERSCKHWCSGKAKSVTYSECVFVELVIKHAVHLRPRPAAQYCPHYLINGKIFEEKFLNMRCVWIFSTTFF